jgi:hypothetical protein
MPPDDRVETALVAVATFTMLCYGLILLYFVIEVWRDYFLK